MIRNIRSELLKSLGSKDIKQTDIKDVVSLKQSEVKTIVNEQIPKKMNEVMNSLLKSISKGEVPLKEVAKELPKNTFLKQSPTLTSEIEKLSELVKKEPSLKGFEKPLQSFMKHISEIKEPEVLQKQILKSGVKLETNIKDTFQNQPLPQRLALKLDTLISLVQKDNFPKALQQSIQKQIMFLKEEGSPKGIENLAKNIQTAIKELALHVNKSPIQPLLKEIQSLDSLLQKYDLISSKFQNEVPKTLQSQYGNKIQESLKSIDTLLKQNSINHSTSKDLIIKLTQNPSLIVQDKTKEELISFVKDIKATINESKNVKPKLENEIKNLENLVKKHDVVVAKIQDNLPLKENIQESKPLHVQYEAKIKESLKNILDLIKQPLPLPKEVGIEKNVQTIQKEVIKNLEMLSKDIQKIQDVKDIIPKSVINIESIKPEPKLSENITSEATLLKSSPTIQSPSTALQEPLQNAVNPQQMTQSVQANQTTLSEPLNVQEQLKSVVNKLKSTLSLLDRPAVGMVSDMARHKEVLKEFQNFLKEPKIMPKGEFKELPPSIKEDIKHTLLKINETLGQKDTPVAKEIKSLTQQGLTKIEMHQLISYASQSLHVYVPFLWESMSEGNISFKANNDNKNFTCKIDLKLKEYGKVNVFLMLFEDNHINVNVSLESSEFKEVIENNLSLLREGLSSVGFIPLHVKAQKLEDETSESLMASSVGMSLRA